MLERATFARQAFSIDDHVNIFLQMSVRTISRILFRIYIYIVLYTSRFFYLFSDNFAQEVVGKLDKNCPSCTNISYG